MVPKVYLCPSDKKYTCSWEGASDDILQHFSEEHEDLLSFSNCVSVDLRDTSENKLIIYDEEIYLLQSKIVNEYLYIFLRYLGPSKIASQITFDIDIETGNSKLDKNYITVRCGYFGISLQHLREAFKEESTLDCVISVSGDFKSLSIETDEEENNDQLKSNSQKENTEEINKVSPISIVIKPDNEEATKNTTELDSSDLVDEVFDKSPDSGISMESKFSTKNLPRSVSFSSLTEDSSTFYINLDASADNSVTRSHSLNDENRRRTIVRKHASVHSLESIQEDDLDLELHCADCENFLFSPIFSCLSGHNFCSYCAVKWESCKLCSNKIVGERNICLEEKAQIHFYSCKYKKNGCATKQPYKDILKHHIGCTFCIYNCPITGCGYSGAFRNIYHHLKFIHSSTKIFESFIATFQKHSDAFLVSEDKGIFYCCVFNLPESVVWEAQFCGPKERKFFCELKFKERNLKEPLLLRQAKSCDSYRIELNHQELKKLKVKSKNAILTITR